MYYPQTKKKKFFQREPDYPCFSVMSATSMLIISRREESVRLLVQRYSLVIQSPRGLVNANSTTCEVDKPFTTENKYS